MDFPHYTGKKKTLREAKSFFSCSYYDILVKPIIKIIETNIEQEKNTKLNNIKQRGIIIIDILFIIYNKFLSCAKDKNIKKYVTIKKLFI